MIYIYTLSDPDNIENVRYVGQTSNIKRRYNSHLMGNKYRKTRCCNWIQSLKNINKQPILNIIDVCNLKDLDKTEQGYIKLFKSLGANLTNHSIGGHSSLGCKHSEESKIKRSINSKGRLVNYTEESMSEKRKKHSEYLKNNPQQRIDNILSKEKRYEAALKGNKIASNKLKKQVIKYNEETQEIITIYNSCREAALLNGISACSMGNRCTGKYKQKSNIKYKYK